MTAPAAVVWHGQHTALFHTAPAYCKVVLFFFALKNKPLVYTATRMDIRRVLASILFGLCSYRVFGVLVLSYLGTLVLACAAPALASDWLAGWVGGYPCRLSCPVFSQTVVAVIGIVAADKVRSSFVLSNTFLFETNRKNA